jgi:hypothetical protein
MERDTDPALLQVRSPVAVELEEPEEVLRAPGLEKERTQGGASAVYPSPGLSAPVSRLSLLQAALAVS